MRALATVTLSAILALASACAGDLEDGNDLPGVDEDETMPVPAYSAVVGKKAKVVNTGGAGLRLRSGPGLSYTIYLVMPQGAIVDCVGGPSGGWYKVKYYSRTGWAYGYYLTPVSSGGGTGGGGSNRLPYTYGVRYRVTQAHGGFSHWNYGYWAWDFGTPVGTAIRAAHGGKVRLAKGSGTYGCCSSSCNPGANYVVVDKGNGTESLYLHLSRVSVHAGQSVARGQVIGHSGNTGYSCGPHLHFQIQRSPRGGGGGWGYWNQALHSYFYDSGSAYDPPVGAYPLSRNAAPSKAAPEGERGTSVAWDDEPPTAPLDDFDLAQRITAAYDLASGVGREGAVEDEAAAGIEDGDGAALDGIDAIDGIDGLDEPADLPVDEPAGGYR